jgi:hypothetical protein
MYSIYATDSYPKSFFVPIVCKQYALSEFASADVFDSHVSQTWLLVALRKTLQAPHCT